MPFNIPTAQSSVDPNRGYAQSPSGPQGASMQPPGLAELLSQLLDQQQQQPVTYMQRGGSPYRGQEYTSPSHPRYRGPVPGQRANVTETTNPGRGYSGSPSNPAAQMPLRQPQPQQPVRDLQPYTGADQIGQQIAGYGMPPRNVDYGVGSASAPWAVGPKRGPKPMSPTFEGPQPSAANRMAYFSSPSGPGWRPPGE